MVAPVMIPAALYLVNTVAQLLQTVEWLYPPLGEFKTQTSFSSWPNRLPTLDQLVTLKRRGGITEPIFQEIANKLGYSNEIASKTYKLTESYLSAGDYVGLFRKGQMSQDVLNSKLTKLGFENDDIQNLMKASEYFPPPQDLISFAVRDVYDPEIVNRFQLKHALPQKFIEEAQKVGVSREQAENYWAAHWKLPSATQGFEMFHRNIISQEDLYSLLQALDYSPYWRDKMKALSYRTLTRVDVRRMYRQGTLNAEQVTKAYRDIGYSPQDADFMTDFTVKYEQTEGEGLTKTAVLNAYKKDFISELELREYLKMLGLDDVVIQFYINITNLEKDSAELEELSNYLRSLYLAGNISLEQAIAEFQTNGAPQHLIQSFTMKLKSRAAQKIKSVPKNDLDTWMKLGIIDESEYSSRMSALGYTESDIMLYLTEYTIENPDGNVKKMPIGTYQRWLKKGILLEPAFRKIVATMGYSPDDINRLVLEAKSGDSKS